jgi:NRPS condensation-like uncharacterized protein
MQLHRLSPLNQVYRYMSMLVNANSCEWIELDGPLDLDRLQRAARAVARRHPVLNSVQRRKGLGFFWQKWPDEVDVDIRYERLSQMTDVQRHRHLVNNIWKEQLPLNSGRPWRLHVSELSDGRTWLQIITTHVFTDGRSANIVARDLSHAYSAEVSGSAADTALLGGAGPTPERDPFALFTANMTASDRQRATIGALGGIAHDALATCDKFAVKAGPAGETGVLFFDLGDRVWQQVRQAGREKDLSAHPFILAAVLRSVETWNAKRGIKTKVLRVIDNFSLRRFSSHSTIKEIYDVFAIPFAMDFKLESGNTQLLAQIKQKLDHMKSGAILQDLFRQRLYMWSSLLSPKRLATKLVTRLVVRSNVICTNIGPVPEDFDSFGKSRVTEYYSFSQMFPPGEIMFLFSTYRGHLRTVLLYDENKVSEHEARDLVENTYRQHLDSLTGSKQPVRQAA